MRGRLAPGAVRSGGGVLLAATRLTPGAGLCAGAGLLLLLPLAPPPAAAASLPGPDTLAVHVETGAGAEYSNEIYYEDAFTDTTFLGRHLVDTPEPRYAGVLYALVQGTHGERRGAYQIANELSLGDKVQREALSLGWRDDLTPDWRLALRPSFEWRHDTSFERDQTEWRGSLSGRLRRGFQDDATGAELGLLADLVRSRGAGSEFLPDRNALRGSLALDHLGLLGDEWRIGYSLATRVFPDSSSRDHYEQGWEGRWRRPLGGGHVLAVETAGRRRVTHHLVTTTRDNFWEETAALAGEIRAADRWSVRARLEGEALQYDLEEPNVYFDYRTARARVGLAYESPARWTLTAGPRAERLSAPLDPDEAYREIAGTVELEVLGEHALWDVTPAAGWRAYDQSGPDAIAAGLHSSFAFYELEALVDQPLMARLRLRALIELRYESHRDPSQNAVSIQLSSQLRWEAR